jgi:hypothetical protein
MANQTGPRTPVGKINSSRNALKKGIYSNALLPDEDADAIEALADDLGQRFEVQDAAGEILVSRVLQTTLQGNRLQNAQAAMIQSKMHGIEFRRKFCVEVDISILLASELPDWYFEEDQKAKQEALEMAQVWAEAMYLKQNHSTELILRAKQALPSLWQYLMGKDGSTVQKTHATLGERIATLFKHQSPQANLQELINALESKHKYAMLYAKNEVKYEAVINGLRGKAVLDVYSDPNWSKADAATHRRTNELIASLIGLQRDKSKTSIIETVTAVDAPKVLDLKSKSSM